MTSPSICCVPPALAVSITAASPWIEPPWSTAMLLASTVTASPWTSPKIVASPSVDIDTLVTPSTVPDTVMSPLLIVTVSPVTAPVAVTRCVVVASIVTSPWACTVPEVVIESPVTEAAPVAVSVLARSTLPPDVITTSAVELSPVCPACTSPLTCTLP